MAHLVRLCARGFNRALSLRLAARNVSFGQWVFLRILWQEDGLTQRELSNRASLTEPTAHAALLRMERSGLVTRRAGDDDRRQRRVFLSERGRALRAELEPLAIEANEVALAGLDAGQREALRAALLGILNNLQADEAAHGARGLRIPSTRSWSG
ncbi:MAG: MarR family transcriptional regulator [Alphaproteobacteria bacterium]|nr:MAG: MarR family transcriptional regulator [Alphaproteobacteria bacterium]